MERTKDIGSNVDLGGASEVLQKRAFPANIYLFRCSNRNTRKICEIFSKLTSFW